MREVIYCPDCESRGYKKRLLEVERETKGTLYCWCKYCKEEKVIKLI